MQEELLCKTQIRPERLYIRFFCILYFLKTMGVLVCGQSMIILTFFFRRINYVQEIDLYGFLCSGSGAD